MKYEHGYPDPHDDETAIEIADETFEAGDQFRFPNGTDRLTGDPRYGLSYVLRVETGDSPSVVFFNVSEEARVTHTADELRPAIENDNLTKLDDKWGADADADADAGDSQ